MERTKEEVKKELCIVCKEREIKIKSRKLCGKCYSEKWNNQEFGNFNPRLKPITLDGEFIFIRNYFKHNNWINQPATFKFKNGARYRPDFYDGEAGTFIEVIGSNDCWRVQKDKYVEFLSSYPSMKLELRGIDGELYCPRHYSEYLKYRKIGLLPENLIYPYKKK